jgi:AraC-like DNA-binding protein
MNNNANGFAPDNSTLMPRLDFEQGGEQDHRSPSQAQPEGARKIELSIHYMKRHLNRPLHVAELAELARTSESHYFALFKRWVGLSPIDYFIRLRMKQACWLLTGSSMSVKEVAGTLGYDDPFYFSRVFKSINGTAPTAYRLRKEEPETIQDRGAPQGLGNDLPRTRLPLTERAEDNGSDRTESAKLLSSRWFSRRSEHKS